MRCSFNNSEACISKCVRMKSWPSKRWSFIYLKKCAIDWSSIGVFRKYEHNKLRTLQNIESCKVDEDILDAGSSDYIFSIENIHILAILWCLNIVARWFYNHFEIKLLKIVSIPNSV